MGSNFSPVITADDNGKNIVIHTNPPIKGKIMEVSNDSSIITININNVPVEYTNRNITIGDLPKLYHYTLSGPDSTGFGKRKSRRRISKRSKRRHKKTRKYIRRR